MSDMQTGTGAYPPPVNYLDLVHELLPEPLRVKEFWLGLFRSGRLLEQWRADGTHVAGWAAAQLSARSDCEIRIRPVAPPCLPFGGPQVPDA